MATAKSAGASKTDKSSAAKNSKGPAAKKAADNGGGTAKRSGSATGNGGSKRSASATTSSRSVRDCQEFDRLSVCVKQTGFGEKQGKFDCIKIRRSRGRHDGKKSTTAASKTGSSNRRGTRAATPAAKTSRISPTRSAKSAASRSSANRKRNESDGKGMLSTIVSKVANIFSPSESTDAIGLLKNDHRTVEELFEKVKANEDGNNAGVFKKIKAELDTHTHIEETIFYPYMLEKGDKELKKIVQEGIEEHRQAKAFLAELAGLAGTSDKFKAKIKVLMEDIEHHVQEEEGDMFPMVRDQFSSDIIDELGARMSSEKAAFKSSGTRSASKRPAPRSTNKKTAAARS